ncbi:hypothetical protein BaRGS_00035335 [Batillaria attramentaria]|uniref:Uncharacterized protein n=1 Tax=Batillaria attramentaria TaxID=370345 RepID=A0ABD0JEN7_9CAEN
MVGIRLGRRFFPVLVWLFHLRPCPTLGTCDYSISFPSLNGSVFTADKHSNISLDFHVEATPPNCTLPADFTIAVDKRDEGLYKPFCGIKRVNMKCQEQLINKNICTCLQGSGNFKLTIVMEFDDSITLVWRLEGNGKKPLARREVFFNVTDRVIPAQIHNATEGASDDSSTASWVTSKAPPEDEVPSEPPVGHGVDFTAIIIAGIAALALVVIAFRIFSARRGEQSELPHDADRRGQTSLTLESRIHTGSNHESNYYWEIHDEPSSPSSGEQSELPHDADRRGQTSLTLESRIHTGSNHESNYYWEIHDEPREQSELPHDADRRGQTSLTLESRIHTGSNHESNYYWEIHDEPNPPRSCLPPAPPEDYLHPSVSAEVQEGTDDAKNVTPFYENSELRPLKLSDVTLGSSSSVVAAVLAHTSVETVSTPAGTDLVCVANENKGSEETKVSAQRGASEDTEYGPETGYMPMNRKLNEGRAETDQESTEYTPMSRGVVSSPPDSSSAGRESGEEPEADVRRVASLHDVSLSHRTGSEGSEWLSTAMENSC